MACSGLCKPKGVVLVSLSLLLIFGLAHAPAATPTQLQRWRGRPSPFLGRRNGWPGGSIRRWSSGASWASTRASGMFTPAAPP